MKKKQPLKIISNLSSHTGKNTPLKQLPPIQNLQVHRNTHPFNSLALKIQPFLKHPSFAEIVISECLQYWRNFDPFKAPGDQTGHENSQYQKLFRNDHDNTQEEWGVKSQIVHIKRKHIRKVQNKVVLQKLQEIRSNCQQLVKNQRSSSELIKKIEELQKGIQQLKIENQQLKTTLEMNASKLTETETKLSSIRKQNQSIAQQFSLDLYQQQHRQTKQMQQIREKVEKELKQKEAISRALNETKEFLRCREAENISLWLMCQKQRIIEF